ncbi:MAG: 50S ribosomal protein L17 [Chloroflexi bacterium]|nr:50S ribosomal protein L17 [Chloroflexota bacterium]
MRHRVAGRKLGRPTNQRGALYRSLVTDLLRHEHIKTTEPKAKAVRQLAEKVITFGKKGTLHDRRQALAFVFDRDMVEKLFTSLAKRYQDRSGGYTRILKLEPRKGDAAPMAILELMP